MLATAQTDRQALGVKERTQTRPRVTRQQRLCLRHARASSTIWSRWLWATPPSPPTTTDTRSRAFSPAAATSAFARAISPSGFPPVLWRLGSRSRRAVPAPRVSCFNLLLPVSLGALFSSLGTGSPSPLFFFSLLSFEHLKSERKRRRSGACDQRLLHPEKKGWFGCWSGRCLLPPVLLSPCTFPRGPRREAFAARAASLLIHLLASIAPAVRPPARLACRSAARVAITVVMTSSPSTQTP
jgi:hypothetical protein